MLVPLRQSLESAELAKAQAESFARDEVAVLAVGLSETVPLSLLADAMIALQEAFPGLHLAIVRSDAGALLEQLESGELELALAAVEDATWERLDIWPLYDENLVFWTAAENPIIRRKSVSISDLKTQHFVSRSYCESAKKVLARLEESGVDTRTQHSINRDQDFELLVSLGLGSGIAPESIEFMERDRIKAVSVSGLELHRTVSLFAVSGRQKNAAVRAGINLIRSSNWAALLEDNHKAVR
jgi:DNA-binding transcriptional LysR family regulator